MTAIRAKSLQWRMQVPLPCLPCFCFSYCRYCLLGCTLYLKTSRFLQVNHKCYKVTSPKHIESLVNSQPEETKKHPHSSIGPWQSAFLSRKSAKKKQLWLSFVWNAIIRELRPSLNIQSDSIIAKLFFFCQLFIC